MGPNNYDKLRVRYYWLAFITSYIFPFAYFAIKLGLTQEDRSAKIVMPVLIIGILGIIKLSSDIPRWVSTWQPSFLKGLIKAVPKILLFIILITLGLTLKYVLENSIDVSFVSYFETVLVLFGGMAVGSIFEAFHLKYKELDLMSKGYVLGVINK